MSASESILIMFNRAAHLTALSLIFLPLACSSGPDDTLTFGSFSTTAPTSFTTLPTTMTMEDSGDTGDGDGDPGDGDPGDGDPGDGDPGDGDGDPGDGDGDPCTPGQFGCTCINGQCDVGLECVNGECVLGGGDGDGDGDGDPGDEFGMCAAQDVYCLSNGCPDTMGQGLVLDEDMDMINDLGWCLFECVDASDCPAHPAGGQVDCIDWSGMGDMACFLNCQVNNPASCAPGSICTTAAGPALCMYDASMF